MSWPRVLPSGDRLIAAILFLFLASRDVTGLSSVRSAAEILLFSAALIELIQGIKDGLRLILNPVFLTVSIFALSVVFACAMLPLPAAGLCEMQTPVLKGMMLTPLALSACALGLIRRGWTADNVALLLLVAFGFSGLGHLIWVLTRYAGFSAGAGISAKDISFHRFKMYAILAAFPFVLSAIRHLPKGRAWLMAMLGAGLAAITITSNSRGAWLALLTSILYLSIVHRAAINRKIIFAALAMAGLLLVAIAVTPLHTQIGERIAEGFNTTHRLGNGIWGATLDMIMQNPWRGGGYGDEMYHQTYNALAESHPEWLIQKSRGAHNVILTHWFAAGVFGLGAILALYAGYLAGAGQLIRVHQRFPVVRDLLHAGLAAFISIYLVRGQVETERWNVFGTLVAVILWLFVLHKKSRSMDASSAS